MRWKTGPAFPRGEGDPVWKTPGGKIPIWRMASFPRKKAQKNPDRILEKRQKHKEKPQISPKKAPADYLMYNRLFPGLWKTLWKMWKTKWEKPQFFCVRRGKPGGKGEKLSQKPSKTRKTGFPPLGWLFGRWRKPKAVTAPPDPPGGGGRRGLWRGSGGTKLGPRRQESFEKTAQT